MKILHVLLSARSEGTPRLVLDWLKVKTIEQELLFLFDNGEIKSEFEKTNVWQEYNTSFIPSFRNSIKIARLVKDVCDRRKPDIVIAWPLGFSHWVAMGANWAGVKRNIAHAGNPANTDLMGRYIHSWMSFGIGHFYHNLIIACSHYVRNSFVEIPFVSKKQFEVVYNCIDLNRFDRPAHEVNVAREKDYIMVATLEKHKDHYTLLKAWAILIKEQEDSRLYIVGDGSLREELSNLAVQLQLRHVFFLGSRNDVPFLLKKCKVFVFSTTASEGFGTVLIEALAAGCRIIASDVPACREVLQQGRYGTLVKAGDVLALKNAMQKALQEPIGLSIEEGMNYAASFSAENMITGYLEKVTSYNS